MDPLTQTVIGAVAAVAVSRREERGKAALVGALAGAFPDVDVLIESAEDPLLGLQYHRHFTHSLIFVPVVGMLVAMVFSLFPRMRAMGFGRLLLYGVVGALTHGLLDACTSYGTQLYWPFHGHRESWDVISIIDPLFTGPLLFALILSLIWRRINWARGGLLVAVAYLGLGAIQRERAESWARELAEQRGHPIEKVTARPSFANQILWRTVYLSEGMYHVDAVSIPPWRAPIHYAGGSVAAFSPEDAAAMVPSGTVLASDIERFRHFSQDFLYRWPEDPEIVGDLRYAVMPDSTRPLWGIRMDTSMPDEHVPIEYFRDVNDGDFTRLWRMILGRPNPS